VSTMAESSPATGASAAVRTIPLSTLVGRAVRDAEGRTVGRIEEMAAEIELHPHGNSYVVTRFAIGRHPWFDRVASGRFVPLIVRRWRRWSGYRRYEVPWQALDLSDPTTPRLRGDPETFATTDP